MFDSVYVRCPSCDSLQEIQSKSGECCLERYSLDDAPMGVMSGILGENSCENCSKVFTIELVNKPTYQITMKDDE